MYRILNSKSEFYECSSCNHQVGLVNDYCPNCNLKLNGTYADKNEIPDIISNQKLNQSSEPQLQTNKKGRNILR